MRSRSIKHIKQSPNNIFELKENFNENDIDID